MAPIGRIFGYREVPAQTSIQRMFNEVGMPQWRTDIKSFIPEIQNDINKYIVSTLEFNADRVIKSPQWKNGDTKSRTEMLRLTLTRSNKETVELFENSINPEDSRTLNLYKLSRKGSGVSKDDVEEALNKLNIDKKITDLDENQLNFLVDYLDLSDAYSSSEAKRALD
jgi:hypothetical protein